MLTACHLLEVGLFFRVRSLDFGNYRCRVDRGGEFRRDGIPLRDLHQGLLALILHNRVAFAGDRGDYLAAVGPAVDLYTLTPDADAARVRDLALSNVGAYFGQRAQYEAAYELAPDRDDLLPRLVEVHLKAGEIMEAKVAAA